MNSTLRSQKSLFNLFQKTTSGFGIMVCLGIFLFSAQHAKAQVSLYAFNEASGLTYSPIVGTDPFAPVGSAWDNNVATVALPFTFNFDGNNYNSVTISSNGFVSFGATIPGISIANPLTTGTTLVGAVSAYGRDLINGGASSLVSYDVTGVSPNRVFVVQYKDVIRKGLTGSGTLNMQIRLYETTNVVETWYDVMSVLPTNASSTAVNGGQVGLRGPNVTFPTNINNVTQVAATTNWPPTSPGIANTSVLLIRNTCYNSSVTRFRWTPPCYAPSTLIANNLTTSTADILWTAPAIAPASYQFEVRSSGTPGSGPVGLGDSGTVAGTSTVANGLTEGFTYTLYVRSFCGGSNYSAWVTGPSFTLPCGSATVPYFLYFDTFSDNFTVPGLPVCTNNYNGGSGNNWLTTNPVFAAGFADEHLRYTFNATQPANTWFVTKGIDLVAGTTYRLSYVYGGSSEFTFITNKMEVRYGTTGSAAGLAAAIQLEDHPEIKTSPFGNVVNFTAPTTDVYYFGFKAYSDADNGSLYLDDIEIVESTCLRPTGLNAPAVLISFNNATITWTAPSPAPANGYAYYYNTTGIAPTNSTPASGTVPAGTTITPIGGLTPNTTYYVWVRSSCGFGEFGEWSVGTSFTTDIAPPTYCTPTGNSVDGTGIINVTFGSINNPSGNEAGTSFYGNYSGLTTNVAQGATVPVNITFSTTFFDYFVKIWVDWNNDGDFVDAGEEVYSGVTIIPNPTTLNASFNVPLAQPLGPRRMRIGGIDDPSFAGGALTPCRSGDWQTFEDYTINVIVAPPPLTLSSTTSTQCGFINSPLVTITSLPLSNFDVYTWSPSAGVTGNPVSGYTFNTGSTTTYILTASQTSGAFSTNTATFTYVANETPTPISIATPNGTAACPSGPGIALNASGGVVSNLTVFSEDFNSGLGLFTTTNASTGGSNTAAPAWTVRPSGHNTGNIWNTVLVSNDNTNFVLSNSDAQGSGSPSITRTTLVSPPIDLTGYTAASLSFYHYFRYIGVNDFTYVQITTNGGGLWTNLIQYTSTQGSPTNFAQAILNLNPYVGNTIQIRFNFQSNWGWGWAIDNFRVVGSATSAIVWSPTTGLFNDAAGLSPYTGTGTNTVYAIPAADQVYQATATAPGPTFCETTQTVAITVTPLVAGTVSGTQSSCDVSSFTNLTLAGHTGNVIRWEYADDAAFTVGVTPIANTTTTLTPAQFGTFAVIRYFRAVVGTGICNPVYSTVASVSTNATILTGTNTWSNGLPDISKRVIIAGNYTASANFSACSVQVLTGATLVVEDGVTVTVQNSFVVDGPSLPNTVVFENNASLVQLSDAINSGSIRYERNTTPVTAYDYTYWSSPVANQVLSALSPNTNPSRFYVFNNTTYAWQSISNALTMDAAKGYIIRSPGTFSPTVPAVFTGGFYGVPHNGPYSIGITVAGAQDRNLVGNPYPSAIDADLLYAANNTVLQGNMFFWTHNTPITANNYNANDYATYNATGGAGTAASPNPGVNPSVPTGNIAAGQGFFVQGLASGTLFFNNTMRLTGLNNLFYRSSNAASLPTVQKHRIWLNIINDQEAYKQMLIGYVQGATNEIDNAFDAEITETGNVVSLYSINTDKKLTIQGRALPFDTNDEVPVGFRTTVPGSYSIELENFDGLFEDGQDIYLEDKLLNVIHNLKESNYTFTTEAGTFEERFEVQFVNETLGVNNPNVVSNAIIVYKNSETIFINSSNFTMTNVKLFDVRGSLIAEKKDVNASEVSFANLNVANQMLLVQITTQEGEVVTRKVAY